MIEAFIQGGIDFFQPITFGLVCGIVVIALILGIIPGLSGLVGCALMLPFMVGARPEVALPLMAAMAGPSTTGGSISAILLGIPGTGANAATILDGFPMTQKGEGGRALGAALGSSGLGGIIGVLMALALMPAIMAIVMAIRTPDIVALVLLGIAFIGVLGGRSVTKGVISGLLGILLSFIGFQANFGMSRFTFGTTFLYDGLGFIPFILGVFAVPELIDLSLRGVVVQQAKLPREIGRDMVEGLKDIFRHFWLFLRSSVIGFIVGVVPGIGAQVAVWVTYGQAMATSKNRDKFGTGTVEGVIAPESANNAKEGGSLLPSLAFGIPGSAVWAIILGGFIAVGLVPGPGMLMEHLPLTFNLLICICVSNVIGAGICLLTVRYFFRVVYVGASYLVPVIGTFVVVGAYAYHENLLDIVVLFAVTILGYCMKRFNYGRAALLLGFILGSLFETNFFISLNLYDGLGFVLRPLFLGILILALLVTTMQPIGVAFRKLTKLVRSR